jgi:hypothetical protein
MILFTYQEYHMAKKRVTVTIDEDLAEFLYATPNTSALVSEAIRCYRNRKLEKDLEAAYQKDAEENAELAAEWESADTEVDE